LRLPYPLPEAIAAGDKTLHKKMKEKHCLEQIELHFIEILSMDDNNMRMKLIVNPIHKL
jgi:hypothetical protein